MNVSVQVQRLQERFPKAWSFGEGALANLLRLEKWAAAKLSRWAELRRVLGTLLPIGVTLVTVVPWMLFGHRLPDEVAIFWDLEGDPAWQLPRAAAGVLLVGLTIALSVGVAGAVREFAARPVSDSSRGALILGVLVFAQTTLAFHSLYNVVFSHLDAESPDDALMAGPGWFIFPVLIGVSLGEMAAATTRRFSTGTGNQVSWHLWSGWWEPPAPGLALAPGERVAWVGTCRSRLLRSIGRAFVALAVLLVISLPGDGVVQLAPIVHERLLAVRAVISGGCLG